MSSDVFISYCRRNLSHAAAIAHDLRASGVSVFLDTEIRVGEFWDRRLEVEINGAAAVITIWTPESVQSQWVCKESRLALRLGKLCPTIIEPCDPPLEFSDVQAAHLVDWRSGRSSHPGWAQLLLRVHQLRIAPLSSEESIQGEVAFRLGKRFFEGKDCPRDLVIARKFLLEASRQGHRRATELLALAGESSNDSSGTCVDPSDSTK